MNSFSLINDLEEWFLDTDLITIFQDICIMVVIPLLIFQAKYLNDFIYLCFHSTKKNYVKPKKIEKEEFKISKSHRYVRYSDTMVKLNKMKEALKETIRSENYSTEELELYEVIEHLLTYEITCKQDCDDVVWIFNNGKFRTQEELDKFEEKKKQKKFLEEELTSQQYQLLQEDNLNYRINNALIINPVIFFPFVTPIGYIFHTVTEIVKYFIKLSQGLLHFDDYLYKVILNSSTIYLFSFLFSFVISYFIMGGINLKQQFDSEKKMKALYEKAGLKKPFNKNLALEAGLYGFNVMQVIGVFRKKK